MVENHFVKNVEVPDGSLPFQAAQGVQVCLRFNGRQQTGQRLRSAFQFSCIYPHPMIPKGSFQHPALIVDLAENEIPSNMAALFQLVRQAILFLAQKDVSLLLSADPGQKSSARGQEGQLNPLPGASAHQGRTGSLVGKADDAFQNQQGILRFLFFPDVNRHVFRFQRKVCFLRRDKQRIQEFSHGSSSPALA